MQEPIEPIRGEAIRTLRKGVVMGSTVVALAIVVQLLTWSFASFTSIRYARIEAPSETRQPVVVLSQGQSRETKANGNPKGTSNDASAGKASDRVTPAEAPADINRLYSSGNSVLHTTHQLALFLGVFGLMMLIPQVWAGVVILAGASGGRLQRATAALQWTIVLTVMCIPWHDWFADLPVGGLLSSFSTMAAQAEAYTDASPDAPAAAVFYAQFLVLPIAGFFAAVLVAFSFHQGVDGAVLQADLVRQEIKIEKEASNREAGSVVYGGRATGAFRAALDKEDGTTHESSTNNRANGHAHNGHDDAPLQKKPKARERQPVGAGYEDGDEDDNGRRPI